MVADKNNTRKAATLIEKLGFRDKDIYNKAHDAICSWLYKHVDEMIKEKVSAFQNNFDNMKKYIEAKHAELISRFPGFPPLPALDFDLFPVQKIPEFMVGRDYVKGFIDLVVDVEFTSVNLYLLGTIHYRDGEDELDYSTSLDEVSIENGKIAVHIIHLYKGDKGDTSLDERNRHYPTALALHWGRSRDQRFFRLCFHVKSAYESMGALKREINFYKPHVLVTHLEGKDGHVKEVDFLVSHYLVGPHIDKIEEEMKQINVQFIEAPAELLKDVEEAKDERIRGMADRISSLEKRVRAIEKGGNHGKLF